MTENMLSWNFTNWVTVVLMVAVGFAVVHLVMGGFKSMKKAPAVGGMSNSPLGVAGN